MEYAELTPDQQEELVSSGMDFMRVITEMWGPEKGMEMWDTISTAVHPDFKGAVFFTMLTGSHIGDVRLVNADVPQYVECIKVVRSYTGYGLKEAKDACDRVRGAVKGAPEKLPLTNKKMRKEFVKKLRELGCEAH
jgi:hypothetical protein